MFTAADAILDAVEAEGKVDILEYLKNVKIAFPKFSPNQVWSIGILPRSLLLELLTHHAGRNHPDQHAV
jgi:hypothetical protein